MRKPLVFSALCVLLIALAAGCNYAKPVMYIQVVNRSGQPMRNLEVKHPTGIFGLPQLNQEETHRHMAPLGTPCSFDIRFDDVASKPYSQHFDLGEKCPLEVAFTVNPGMQVSEATLRP